KDFPGPDHRFSADLTEFSILVNAIRTVEKGLGDSCIGPTCSEVNGRRDFRLSCVAADFLKAGHVLTADDLVFGRPGTGVPPAQRHLLVGRTLKSNMEAGTVIQVANLE